MDSGYIHGFSRQEQQRLIAQAQTLAPSVFRDLQLPEAGNLLEIGCGVGAELKLIARRRPHLHLTGMDMSLSHLLAARDHLGAEIHRGLADLVLGDAHHFPFADASFDAIITIWMLEHVADPRTILSQALRLLRPGGELICTEVDNAQFGFEPAQPAIAEWWKRFNRYQADKGGNPFVGGRLAQAARDAGATDVHTEELRIISSEDEPERHGELLKYLRDLLLSGAQQLIRSGYTDTILQDRMQREFAAVDGSDVRFFYHGIRLSVRKIG